MAIDPIIWATPAGYVLAAVVGLFGKKNYDIMRGNGKGNLSEMAGKLLDWSTHLEDKVDTKLDKIGEHLGQQDAAIGIIKDRVTALETHGEMSEKNAVERAAVVRAATDRIETTQTIQAQTPPAPPG